MITAAAATPPPVPVLVEQAIVRRTPETFQLAGNKVYPPA